MRILKVIHGYPPLYNAGSEVYSQMLCHGLAREHEVEVFTREENPFAPDFAWRKAQDNLEPAVKLNIINISGEKYRYRYQHPQVDQLFADLLQQLKPDIIHIGHLNHLSTSLIYKAVQQKIPLVYTLHDYWLMCPRGQFIQRNTTSDTGLWALCEGQDNQKCAKHCYAGYFSGSPQEEALDVTYWSDWAGRRMQHIREIMQPINYFIAPSYYLYQRYVNAFPILENKITYLDYGFDLQRLTKRQRTLNEPFTFGYIGTHIPAKGIQQLITAFAHVKGAARLRIWGRPRAQNTEGLRALAAQLPASVQARIEWLGEYRNERIVDDVFNHVDCIVVPSIWVENSPLVIHEALQVRLPVITADAGGMAEYIVHEQNGLLFEHRNSTSLGAAMQRLADNPAFARQLGARGYWQSADGNIPAMATHVKTIEAIYQQLLQ